MSQAGREVDWPGAIHRRLGVAGVRLVGYVPDAGHKRLIELCQADRAMRTLAATGVVERVEAEPHI